MLAKKNVLFQEWQEKKLIQPDVSLKFSNAFVYLFNQNQLVR